MKLWLQPLGSAAESAPLCLDHFPYVIGRRGGCDGCLPYAFISRRHCRFDQVDGQVVVQDLESYNGTFVNGTPATKPHPLSDGDELTLGPMSFRVVLPRGEQETARDLKTRPDLGMADSQTHSRPVH
jgi:pSer/pThr/pTyr-binding forkhead associated (FHA) protein